MPIMPFAAGRPGDPGGNGGGAPWKGDPPFELIVAFALVFGFFDGGAAAHAREILGALSVTMLAWAVVRRRM